MREDVIFADDEMQNGNGQKDEQRASEKDTKLEENRFRTDHSYIKFS